jgi:hypothetical protein
VLTVGFKHEAIYRAILEFKYAKQTSISLISMGNIDLEALSNRVLELRIL